MSRFFAKFLSLLLLTLFGLESAVVAAVEVTCQKVESSAWAETSAKWQGRELVAFASWCSSCKEEILNAASHPEQYVLMVAFDDVESSARVLRKLNVAAPCIYGDDLVTKLGVTSLPWTKKI